MKKVLVVGSARLADPSMQVRLQAVTLASLGHGRVSTNARAMCAVSSYCHHANTTAFHQTAVRHLAEGHVVHPAIRQEFIVETSGGSTGLPPDGDLAMPSD